MPTKTQSKYTFNDPTPHETNVSIFYISSRQMIHNSTKSHLAVFSFFSFPPSNSISSLSSWIDPFRVAAAAASSVLLISDWRRISRRECSSTICEYSLKVVSFWGVLGSSYLVSNKCSKSQHMRLAAMNETHAHS
jgi:hypothetical protein